MPPDFQGRIWRFADCEFDELSRELRVRGSAVPIEAKPLDILIQLLAHPGEVLTKEELLTAVWSDVEVVDGSLATAVSKLRKALGDDDRPVIATIPRIGYRLAVPVICTTVGAPPVPALEFSPGDPVPRREQWVLVERLERSGSSDVWVAEHSKTRERRVFKFAADAVHLQGLKREITVSRLLRDALGERPDFVRMLEWNLEAAPFFLESEYAGPNLAQWTDEQRGLANVPRAVRLQILVDVARAVAAAHDLGVLHKDLKPGNILMAPTRPATVKVADFGSAALSDPSRLQALGITNLGFTTSSDKDGSLTGTLMYMAPEVLAGQSPSASADVYALGVLLYQMLVGDFRTPLAAGWEAGIDDPILCRDIADAASGDPAKRLHSAAAFAERLSTVDARRTEYDALEAARRRAEQAERSLAVSRARRPWMAAAVVALAVGLTVSLAWYQRAARERDEARRQTQIAGAISQFLGDDLIGRSNPFQSGAAAESITDAVKQASPSIDRKFNDEPLVAARLHHTIARALDNRTEYAAARHEYDRAAALYRVAEGEPSPGAVVVQLQRVTLEARSYEKGSLELAKSILAAQEQIIAKRPAADAERDVWLASARGMVALIDNRAKAAAEEFERALAHVRSLPAFDEMSRLTFQQRLAFAYIRLGDGARAEAMFKELIDGFTRVAGADSPNVLRVRLNLAQAYMIQAKHAEAIDETTAIYPEFQKRLGPDHELTMQVLTTRAQSEASLGRWDDAVRDDLAIYDLAVKKQGPQSFFAVATLSDASLAMCRAGRTEEGVTRARLAYTVSAQAFGPRAGLTGGTASTLAACLIDKGALDESSRLLKDIDIPAVAQLAGDPDWGAGVTLLAAKIAYRRGDYAAARKHLETVKPVFTRANAEKYQRAQLETLERELSAAP
ncbi:MAG: protein kinase domain-containing protein [Vicinamibacterales bacterium]